MARSGRVYVQDEYAGMIRETDDGYEFSYDREYLSKGDAVSISLTLPLSEQQSLNKDEIVWKTKAQYYNMFVELKDTLERDWL
jgi:HipA-like protein